MFKESSFQAGFSLVKLTYVLIARIKWTSHLKMWKLQYLLQLICARKAAVCGSDYPRIKLFCFQVTHL